MSSTWISLAALVALVPTVHKRLQLSRAKHRSLAGHSRLAKLLARWLPGYHFDEQTFFKCDNAPYEIQNIRREAFYRLAYILKTKHPLSIQASIQAQKGISDLKFISAYRVPFQFSPMVQENLKIGSFLQSASGVQVTDLDGNSFYDLTGSYGVNVFGADFYKSTMAKGMAMTENLGATLGVYHPCVATNVERLKKISGMDEVSFHMSGTEAVMQAVRLARYQNRRKYIVRFCGAYHGWWEDVQPGPGNPMPPRETYTLSEMSERSLTVLRNRKDIACVLINPLQALHPNMSAPSDSTLVDSSRRARFDRSAYTEWLKKLRETCTANGIALIFDEVFMGFRLAEGGAQAYFDVQADMVTYGKTLGGGFPIGVVCGKQQWMRRFHPKHPADICFARGTFKEHPAVMGAMSAFLDALESPEVKSLYDNLDETWNKRRVLFNDTMKANDIPLHAENLSSVWTILYTTPSRYNWMLQYYLRVNGLALSWVGTGRLIFSLNYSDSDFEEVLRRFVVSAKQMKSDGWWWHAPELTNKKIRRSILEETLFHPK